MFQCSCQGPSCRCAKAPWQHGWVEIVQQEAWAGVLFYPQGLEGQWELLVGSAGSMVTFATALWNQDSGCRDVALPGGLDGRTWRRICGARDGLVGLLH